MPKVAAYEPELVIDEARNDGKPFYLSSDGLGASIAWDTCHGQSGGCGQPIMQCNCKGGPKEPFYITRWRAEAEGLTYQRPRSSTTIGSAPTSVRSRVREAVTEAKSLSMTDFIDADVIARVKAASEEPREQS